MFKRALTALAVAFAFSAASSPAWSQKDIRWGTPPVGTSGHKALVILSAILNKEMPQYRISVLPTPGAITTVKGYATHELDGMYGSDIAFHELATDTNRFKGFKSKVKRQPMQSFWSNTIEVGLAVHARNKDTIKKWGDLNGKRVFTGPLPFDTRAQTERALAALNVKFTYVQIDLAAVGSQLESGAIDAMSIYTGGEKAPPPWLAEASLAADWAALNPSSEEVAEFKKKNLSVVEVSPQAFKRDVHVAKVIELPFYYGFHVGLEVMPADDVYKMLKIIEANAAGARQVRSDLLADRQGHARLPEARRGILGRPRADPSRSRQVHAREGRMGQEVGFQGRHDVGYPYHSSTRRAQPRARSCDLHANRGAVMTDTPLPRSRIVLDCIYYAVAIFFFLYLFSYFWTSEGGPTLLAMTLVPVTFVLFTLNSLRENDLYPRLPAAANYAIAAVYVGCALTVAVYMNNEYYELGTSRAGSWDPSDLFMGGSWRCSSLEYSRKRHMPLFVLNIVLILYAVYG